MESPAQREERITRLEQQRAQRHAEQSGTPASVGTVWPTPDDAGTGVIPLEIGPGRGDLNYSSGFVPTFPTALGLVSGKTVSFARIFQTQPWIAACVMKIMSAAVRVPLKVYRKTGEENSRVRLYPQDHPLAAALDTPWDRGSMAQLVMALLGPVLVHGNSVTEIENGANDAIRFTGMDWRFTRPLMPFRDTIDGFTFNVDAPSFMRSVSVDQVLHVAWWSPVGPVGTSPLQQLGVTLNVEDAAQRYQRALFQNGARPPGAVTTSEDFLGLDPKERRQIMTQLRADIDYIYAGPENQGRPALLPPGLDWKPIANGTAVEAALIEQRNIAKSEIYGVYQVPETPQKATPQTADVLRQMLYVDCLGPPLALIEQAINAQVITAILAEPDVYCEFDFGAVLRGDRLAEITALKEAIGTMLLTPNEGRDALNLPRSDLAEMNSWFGPFNNLWPLGQPLAPGGKPEPMSPPANGAGFKRLHVRSRDRDYEEVLG